METCWGPSQVSTRLILTNLGEVKLIKCFLCADHTCVPLYTTQDGGTGNRTLWNMQQTPDRRVPEEHQSGETLQSVWVWSPSVCRAEDIAELADRPHIGVLRATTC